MQLSENKPGFFSPHPALRFNKWSNSFNNLTRSAAVLKCDFVTFRLLKCWQAWHTIKSQDLCKCEMKWGHYHIFCDCEELLEFWQSIKDEVAVTKWWMLTSHYYKCIILYLNATAWFPWGMGLGACPPHCSKSYLCLLHFLQFSIWFIH